METETLATLQQIGDMTGIGVPALLAYIIYLHTRVKKNGNGSVVKEIRQLKENHLTDIEKDIRAIRADLSNVKERLVRVETKLEE